ncbi:MAG: FHA domain-containing protein [Bacteriovoracaceae bacterium]|nr:FHA domain-containing protein [Bacteriovoracaceae bacterium]
MLINDPTVEGKHCSFIVNDNVASVIDHNSSLGTYIDGQRIPSDRFVILMNGDKLKIGDVAAEVKFQEGDMSGNLYLYQLGSQAKAEAKSVEQLFVDQIINEVDMAGPVVEEKPEPSGKISATQILKLHATKEISPEDKTSDNIQIPKEFKAPKKKKGFKLELDNLFSSKPKKTKVQKVKVMKIASNYGPVEAMVRLLSVLVELSFANFLYHQALFDLTFTFEGILLEIKNTLALPELDFIFTDYKELLITLMVFSLLRLISVVAFSVSYSQFILSFASQSDGSSPRLGGIIREGIGLILLPISLCLDWILILHKPTLKETLSRYPIGLQSKVSAIVYSIVLVPLSLVIFMLNPLLKDFSLKEEFVVNVEKKATKQNNEALSFQNSLFYELQVLSSFESDFEVLPVFSPQGDLTETELLFVHKKDDVSFRLRKYDHKMLVNLLRQFQQSDLFFSMSYPMLNQALESNQLKSDVTTELQDLFLKSFGLNLMSLMDHVMTQGPMTNAYISLRESLVKELGVAIFDKFTITNQLGNDHIRIDSHIPKKSFQIFYIPLSLSSGPLLRVEIVASYEKSLEIANNFFSNTKKLPKINKDELVSENTTAMGLLDSMSNNSELAASHIQTFFTEKKKTIIATNPVNFDDYKRSVQSTLKFIQIKMKPLKDDKKVAWEQAIDTLELLIK